MAALNGKPKAPASPRRGDETLLDPWLHDRLFDLVPSAIAVIDKDWRVVRANRTFEEQFGEWQGRRCYEVYKGKKRKCPRCLAARCFADGETRTRHEVGVDWRGRALHYFVHIVPVTRPDGSRPYLVEMSTDITRQSLLRDDLARASAMNLTLIEVSGDAIVAFDPRMRVRVFNPAAVDLFGWRAPDVVGRAARPGLLPEGFVEAMRRGDAVHEIAEAKVTGAGGEEVPVRFYGVRLALNGESMGSAAFYHDLRERKQLEREKLDAERLVAVGQTVAGLAHGVKNILTGLEGGLYLTQTGLDKGQAERARDGFTMLRRNIGKVSSFVRTLLDFSRGRAPATRMTSPVAIAEDVVQLFREAASREGIAVALDARGTLDPAPLDPDGIHTCLANLVTNAIDACRMSERAEKIVRVAVFEAPDVQPSRRAAPGPSTAIHFEVWDNGVGLDYEVKQKVFTNFFTTKGEGGTGLGLLVTRKIVQEHGGKIEMESEEGRGTVFRIVLPRRRLPQPVAEPPPGPAGEGDGGRRA